MLIAGGGLSHPFRQLASAFSFDKVWFAGLGKRDR
jgi:hypothetical protein